MLGSEVSFGEDALSTYYSTGSATDCSSLETMPSTSSVSSNSSVRRSSGSVLSFLKLNWFGFGAHVDPEKDKKDKDVIDRIMKCFRVDDVAGMEKFLEVERSKQHEDELWWDDSEFSVPEKEAPMPKSVCKGTPHPKKAMSHLPPSVRKTVRFEMDCTPDNKEPRPFTPLFTSTPKHYDVPSDEEEPVPSTRLNNTSSILLANTSVMGSWNKSREQTAQALETVVSRPTHYRICYDDTDEEEVVEDEIEEATERRTFTVVNPDCEQSFESDTSTGSSVVLGLERIEDYIRSLEGEIETAKRYQREQDVNRAHGAVRNAHILQERLGQMNEVITEMCGKWTDCGGDGDHEHGVSAVFDNSCWAAQLDGEDGSFDGQQL